MWTKIILKQKGQKKVEFENVGQLRYVTQGALIVEPDAGKETLYPWSNIACIETSGITQDDLTEIRDLYSPGEEEDQPELPFAGDTDIALD